MSICNHKKILQKSQLENSSVSQMTFKEITGHNSTGPLSRPTRKCIEMTRLRVEDIQIMVDNLGPENPRRQFFICKLLSIVLFAVIVQIKFNSI